MIDYTPLHHTVFAASDEKEVELLKSLITSIQQGSPDPRRFYISGDAGLALSEYSLDALKRVLRFAEDEEISKRRSRVLHFSKDTGVTESKMQGTGSTGKKPGSRVSTSATRSGRVQIARKLRGRGVKILDVVDSPTQDEEDAEWPQIPL